MLGTILVLIITSLFASITFILANTMRNEEDDSMNNVIKVTPNKDGKIYITLYGTKYEIVIEKPAKPSKNEE